MRRAYGIVNLQYLMGHSDIGITLNTYTHVTYDKAAEQLAAILAFPSSKSTTQKAG